MKDSKNLNVKGIQADNYRHRDINQRLIRS